MGMQTTVRFFMKILLPILIISVLSGGAEKAAADGRKLFLIHITREGSSAVTTMHVRAEDIEEARSQIVLNGWKLIRIEEKELPEPSADHKFRYTGDNSKFPAGTVRDKTLTAQTLPVQQADSLGSSLPAGSPALLIDDNYTYIGTLYFSIGEFQAEVPAELGAKISSLSNSGEYLILGHTDTLRVMDNNRFDSNFDLARKRAEYLKSVLVSDGISSVNIAANGMGTLMPAAENMRDGQPMNRRADLYERR
nr:OmpA family protein [Geovibrio thiophilus]